MYQLETTEASNADLSLVEGTKRLACCDDDLGSDKTTATTATPTTSSSVVPRAEIVIEKKCCWIHNALTIPEQIEVLEDLLDRSKHNTARAPKTVCMNPSPKTIRFDDGNTPTLRFDVGTSEAILPESDTNNNDNNDTTTMTTTTTTTPKPKPLSSVYDRLILRKAIALTAASSFPRSRQRANPPNRSSLSSSSSSSSNSEEATTPSSSPSVGSRQFGYDAYSVAAIDYTAPNGSFPEHIDHCNDPNGWVVLLSLGCTAVFTVRGPGSGSSHPRKLALESGDVLVFDPSTEAAVRHGVASIVPSTCPEELSNATVEAMANHRYGIQCRTSLHRSITPEPPAASEKLRGLQ